MRSIDSYFSMHRMLIILCMTFVVLGLFIWLTRPISTHAITYLWWRLFEDKTLQSDTVYNHDAEIYYQTYGHGNPLILLHGGLSSSLDWFSELPGLSKAFQVVTIDLRGHGRSTLGSRPFTYELLASDVIAVLNKLKIEKADFAGWSDGGNVALIIALNYPQRVRRLITISANFNPSGLTDDAIAMNNHSGPYDHSLISRLLYRMFSPNPAQWQTLWQQVTQLWKCYPQLRNTDLTSITSSTLVIVGANDVIDAEHAEMMATYIPNARQVTIPHVGHAVLKQAPETMLSTIKGFLGETTTSR